MNRDLLPRPNAKNISERRAYEQILSKFNHYASSKENDLVFTQLYYGSPTRNYQLNQYESAREIKIDSQYPGIFAELAHQFSDDNINPTVTNPLWDVILSVDSDKVYCHKLVLALTSKFFKNTFSYDRPEIKLTDIDLKTLKSLLNFMYQDEISGNDIDSKLLIASAKYEVLRLKEICIQHLSNSLNQKNVVEIWNAAHYCKAEELLHDCLVFMTKHWNVLNKNDDIQEVAENYPRMLFIISSLLAEERAPQSTHNTEHMQIFLQTSEGKTITLNVNRSSTIKDLKDIALIRTKIPIDLQVLEYGGKLLEDKRKLSDYKIQKESTLRLIVRRRVDKDIVEVPVPPKPTPPLVNLDDTHTSSTRPARTRKYPRK